LGYSRLKSVLSLGATAALLVIASTASFGMVAFFTEFVSYGGGTKSLFDVIYDVFYDTILPLNGFIVCLFVIYRWRHSNFNAELSTGDDDFEGSFIQKYVNFSVGTFIPVILALVFINTVCIKFFGMNSLLDIF